MIASKNDKNMIRIYSSRAWALKKQCQFEVQAFYVQDKKFTNIHDLTNHCLLECIGHIKTALSGYSDISKRIDNNIDIFRKGGDDGSQIYLIDPWECYNFEQINSNLDVMIKSTIHDFNQRDAYI